jgi:hypothetical protein
MTLKQYRSCDGHPTQRGTHHGVPWLNVLCAGLVPLCAKAVNAQLTPTDTAGLNSRGWESADQVAPLISVETSYDVATGTWTYSYTISNAVTARQGMLPPTHPDSITRNLPADTANAYRGVTVFPNQVIETSGGDDNSAIRNSHTAGSPVGRRRVRLAQQPRK